MIPHVSRVTNVVVSHDGDRDGSDLAHPRRTKLGPARAVKTNGGAMAGPFIFIAINRLKPGKLEDEKKRVPDLVDFIQANEPRLIAFNEYASEDDTEVAVVQVHPDADSMAFHMA